MPTIVAIATISAMTPIEGSPMPIASLVVALPKRRTSAPRKRIVLNNAAARPVRDDLTSVFFVSLEIPLKTRPARNPAKALQMMHMMNVKKTFLLAR